MVRANAGRSGRDEAVAARARGRRVLAIEAMASGGVEFERGERRIVRRQLQLCSGRVATSVAKAEVLGCIKVPANSRTNPIPG